MMFKFFLKGKKREKNLTLDYVNNILYLDNTTGMFYWKNPPSIRVKVGDIAGRINSTHGYVEIGINGRKYQTHRLVWFVNFEKWPKNQIDHIDNVRTNNILSNLREATNKQNSANKLKNKNNTSGYKGVYFSKRNKNWCAKIQVDGRTLWLGVFNDPKDAANAYTVAAAKYFK